jgi:hypothetical protein
MKHCFVEFSRLNVKESQIVVNIHGIRLHFSRGIEAFARAF